VAHPALQDPALAPLNACAERIAARRGKRCATLRHAAARLRAGLPSPVAA